MLSQRHNILLVPSQISAFVYDNKLVKSFSIFLYLKMFAGDKVSATDEIFAKLRGDLKMIDPKGRTFQKHFQPLLDHNWIGYNSKSGVYHIRSFDYIRAVNGFKKRSATKLFLKDLLQLQVYLVGVLVCNEVYKQQFYWEKVKGKSRAATRKRDVANQSKAPRHSSQPAYYGICNDRIAHLLGCKYTRACVLKQAAADAGYLTNRHRYADIQELEKADYAFRPMFADGKPAVGKKLRFWRQIKDGKKIVKVVQQLHDEIIPHMQFKRTAKFSALKVPFSIIKGFLPYDKSIKAA
jgi:hypothetical protein